jgi:4'-phosphopantetheinyl transferase
LAEPHVRWARASESDFNDDYAILNAEERERAGRFRYEVHRRRWVFARGWLRRSLGELLGMRSEAIEFSTGSLGKPYLQGYPLHFNLGHSGDLVILAWAEDREVGVDIEEVKEDFGWEDVARHAFSASELSYLEQVPQSERRAAFYEIWTLKEAYVKALGCGIGMDTSEFSVRPEGGLDAKWRVRELPVESGYAAAVAWQEGEA